MTMPPQYPQQYPQYPPQPNVPQPSDSQPAGSQQPGYQPQYQQPQPPYMPPVNPELARRRIMRQAVGRPAGMVLAYYLVAQIAGGLAMFVMLLPYLGQMMGQVAGNYSGEAERLDQLGQSGQFGQSGQLDQQNMDSLVNGVMQQSLQVAGWANIIGFGVGIILIMALNRSVMFRREFWLGGAAYRTANRAVYNPGTPDGQAATSRPVAAHMRPGWLLDFIVLMITAQAAFTLLQLVMTAFGADVVSPSMDYISQSSITWEMWLFVGLIGPIFEEIVFRGVLLGALAPYGRNFAIVTSAVMFGLYHGDFTQGLFAFVMGLLLGFVAMEYSLLWSIVLHVFNNAVISGLLGEFASQFGDVGEGVYSLTLLVVGIVGGLVVFVRHGCEIRAYSRAHRSPRGTYWGWTSARFLIYVALTGIMVLASLAAILLS